jgi:hypothetical protein
VRRLVDQLVRMSATAAEPSSSTADTVGDTEGPWQLQLAAVTAVASEVVLGASSTWHPGSIPAWGGPGQSSATKPSGPDAPSFQASVQVLVAQLAAPGPWQVPTHVPSQSQPGIQLQQAAVERIPAQVRAVGMQQHTQAPA